LPDPLKAYTKKHREGSSREKGQVGNLGLVSSSKVPHCLHSQDQFIMLISPG